MFIEPCCAHKQLPQLIRASCRKDSPSYTAGISVFQTNGDVTLQKALDAMSSLIDESPFVILLSESRIDVPVLRHLAYYYRRGWMSSLLLLDSSTPSGQTSPCPTTDIEKHLPPQLLLHSRIISHEAEGASPLFACIGRRRLLVVTGSFLQGTGNVTQHTAYLGSNPAIVQQFLAPVLSRFRIMSRDKTSIPTPRLDEIIAGHLFD